MKRIIGLFISVLLLLFFTVGTTTAQKDYCFENDGLKVKQTITMTITGAKIEGTMESGGYETTNSAETFDFTGTKKGSSVTIKFAGKPPYELAPGTKRIVWPLTTKSLKVPTYGKNYNTGKYSAYVATFAKCKKGE